MSQESEKPDPSDNPKPPTDRRMMVLAVVNLTLAVTSLGLVGYVIHEQSKEAKAEKPVAQNAEKAEKATEDIKPEMDKLKDQIKHVDGKVDRIVIPPDPGPRLKMIDDRLVDVGKTLADLTDRSDALGKKVDAASKVESSSRFDVIEQRIGAVAAELAGFKADLEARRASATMVTNEMERAVDLFKTGKYAEAKEAFAKLQGQDPDDARVWYFSALANGLATGDWKGESERLVALGMAREKSGTPDKAKINAAFADLTTATGKDWLGYYRGRAVH